MGAVLESLNSVKEVVEDIDEASKESSEVTINIILKLGSFSIRICPQDLWAFSLASKMALITKN